MQTGTNKMSVVAMLLVSYRSIIVPSTKFWKTVGFEAYFLKFRCAKINMAIYSDGMRLIYYSYFDSAQLRTAYQRLIMMYYFWLSLGPFSQHLNIPALRWFHSAPKWRFFLVYPSPFLDNPWSSPFCFRLSVCFQYLLQVGSRLLDLLTRPLIHRFIFIYCWWLW